MLVDGAIVGRIMKVQAAPEGSPWMWTLAYGHHEDRWPIYCYEPTREAAIAIVHEELTAGVVLGRSAFGGKPENMCSFRALPPLTPSGDSEAFTGLAYRRQSTHRAMEAWYNPSIA